MPQAGQCCIGSDVRSATVDGAEIAGAGMAGSMTLGDSIGAGDAATCATGIGASGGCCVSNDAARSGGVGSACAGGSGGGVVMDSATAAAPTGSGGAAARGAPSKWQKRWVAGAVWPQAGHRLTAGPMTTGASRGDSDASAVGAGGGGVAIGGADGRAVSAPPQPLQNLLEPSFCVPQAAQNTIIAPRIEDFGHARKKSAPANALDESQPLAVADRSMLTAEHASHCRLRHRLSH